MFFRNKPRRRHQAAFQAVQTLESRAMLSATAVLQNRMLTITGTPGGDRATIQNFGNQTVVFVNGLPVGIFSASKIGSITANMGGGDDILNIPRSSAQYDRITINMGTGTNDFAYVGASLVKTLTFDGRSTRTEVQVSNMTVNSLQATFGNAGDSLKVWDSIFNTVDVDLGSGDDTLYLYGTSTIRAGQLKMGNGNDFVLESRSTSINATVFGGSGYDQFFGPKQDRGVRLNSFEKIIWQ